MPLPFSDSGYGSPPLRFSTEQWRGLVEEGFDWGKLGNYARAVMPRMATSFFSCYRLSHPESNGPTKTAHYAPLGPSGSASWAQPRFEWSTSNDPPRSRRIC